MYLYRYEDHVYASYPDEWGDSHSSSVRINLHQFFVYKETPCGYWIDGPIKYKSRRWVSKTSKKRFAHAIRDDAWFSFQKRKVRQIAIYKAKLERAQTALMCARPDIQQPACDDPTIQNALSKFKEVLINT